MFKRILGIFAVLALLVFSGCGKAPQQEMQTANTAIQAAQSVEAEAYAPDVYQMAMDTLRAAEAAKTEADSKFALFRSYGKSKELYLRAEALAKEAESAAVAEKQQVKVEVEGMITQANQALEDAKVAYSKAPRGKGSKADLELIKNDLDATSASFEEAKIDYDAGNYAAAKAKLTAVMRKAQSISEEIGKAAAKKTGK
jgi:hypothetical protein